MSDQSEKHPQRLLDQSVRKRPSVSDQSERHPQRLLDPSERRLQKLNQMLSAIAQNVMNKPDLFVQSVATSLGLTDLYRVKLLAKRMPMKRSLIVSSRAVMHAIAEPTRLTSSTYASKIDAQNQRLTPK